MKRTKVKWLVLSVILLVLAALIVFKVLKEGPTIVGIEKIEQKEGIAVAVERPVRMDFTDYVTCDGQIDTVNRYVLRASIAEIVETVHVDVGDVVEEGQVLMEFRNADLDADVSMRMVAYQEAKNNLRRYEALLEKGGAAESRVEAHRTALENAEAMLRHAESRLAFTKIRVPAGGGPGSSVQVEARFVEPGERKGEGKELITLVELSRLEVRALVPESAVQFAREGTGIEFRMEGEKAWRSCVITRVSPATKHPNRFFEIFAGIDNERGEGGWIMQPGMYAEARIPRGVARDALAVQSSAVKRKGANESLFVVRAGTEDVPVPEKEGFFASMSRWFVKLRWWIKPEIEVETVDIQQAWKIDVKTDLRREGYVQLTGGDVSGEDRVISNPRDVLRDGLKVKIVE